DQLDAAYSSWKSYQENLPLVGADRVNNSDGVFVDTNDLTVLSNPKPTSSSVVALYAVKHNPFVYFKSVQESGGLKKVVGFDGLDGLYADLRTGHVPAYSFVAPNQCNDQHGKSGMGVYCGFDPKNDGTQNGLNPGLIYRGDATVQKIVGAIKASPAWGEGHNAIVVVWDENDYAVNTPNRVLTMVETNYARNRVVSNNYYNHFSLLKTIEGALGLPCLNHACDDSVAVMSDLFGR
ncbi:MAG: alkaline phosphatase family protein, partial [Caldimonas sp.]